MQTNDQLKSMKQADIMVMYLAEKAAREKAEAALAARQTGKLTLRVSPKGAMSIYGLTERFPITLYVSQWQRLMAILPEIEAFIAANSAVKPDKLGKDKDGNPVMVKDYLVPAKTK